MFNDLHCDTYIGVCNMNKSFECQGWVLKTKQKLKRT